MLKHVRATKNGIYNLYAQFVQSTTIQKKTLNTSDIKMSSEETNDMLLIILSISIN